MLKREATFAELQATFKWEVPERFNIGVAACDRWADGSGRRAVIVDDRNGEVTGQKALGVTINEFYGQTECNIVVSGCAVLYPRKSGAIGRAVPGHTVAVVDERGVPVVAGVTGNIAIESPDPVMFLGYWNNPKATAEKFAGNYLLTGDLGEIDTEGYIRYVGRDDDVITSAGYRIGPGPIEECLLKHPSVRMAAVIGKKDPQRTEIVKAFIVLADGFQPSEQLVAEIQDFVRQRLAAHEYPREISFMDALPSTVTGKVMRRSLREADESESKAPWDYYKVAGVVPASEAFPPLAQSSCPLLKK